MREKVELKVVATGTITRGARISLGKKALTLLDASIGDLIEIYLDEATNRLYIAKVLPPAVKRGEARIET